jgi:hypothetical protein
MESSTLRSGQGRGLARRRAEPDKSELWTMMGADLRARICKNLGRKTVTYQLVGRGGIIRPESHGGLSVCLQRKIISFFHLG